MTSSFLTARGNFFVACGWLVVGLLNWKQDNALIVSIAFALLFLGSGLRQHANQKR